MNDLADPPFPTDKPFGFRDHVCFDLVYAKTLLLQNFKNKHKNSFGSNKVEFLYNYCLCFTKIPYRPSSISAR